MINDPFPHSPPFLCCRYSDSPTAELESRAPKSRSSKNKDGKGRHDKDGGSSDNPRKNLRSSKVCIHYDSSLIFN